MNEAIKKMLTVPGTHYVTDPDQMKKGGKQQVFPVEVVHDGSEVIVHQLHAGNQLGVRINPETFRSDAIVLRHRPKFRRLKAG